jgi:hypothetical protein
VLHTRRAILEHERSQQGWLQRFRPDPA